MTFALHRDGSPAIGVLLWRIKKKKFRHLKKARGALNASGRKSYTGLCMHKIFVDTYANKPNHNSRNNIYSCNRWFSLETGLPSISNNRCCDSFPNVFVSTVELSLPINISAGRINISLCRMLPLKPSIFVEHEKNNKNIVHALFIRYTMVRHYDRPRTVNCWRDNLEPIVSEFRVGKYFVRISATVTEIRSPHWEKNALLDLA